MALANVGELLADMGYRVILSDWDLEAPGLERYLWPHDPREHPYRQEDDPLLARPGLVELLEEYKQNLSDPGDDTETSDGSPDEFATVGTVRLRRPSSRLVEVSKQVARPGSLRLLTAGRRDGEHLQQYAESIRRFDWQEFYDRWAGDAYIEFFRKDLVGELQRDVRGAGDILLIDSRTGVTEHGGVGTHHLADVVVVMTAANDLNMDGTRWMVDALRDPQLTELRNGRALRVIPVASRIEQNAQRDELLDFRRRFLATFRDALKDSVDDPETFALASEIKYMPFYSFYERVVAREPEDDREHQLAAAYRTIAEGIVGCGVTAGLLREPTSQGIVARAPAIPQAAEARAPQWDHDKFLRELIAVVDARDRVAAAELTDGLEEHLRGTDDVYPERHAVAILRHLRRKLDFDVMQRAAEKLIEYGQSAPRVRLLYAQSLIEQGNLAAARSTLQTVIAELRADDPRHAEARGLLARVFARQYLEVPDPSSYRSRNNLERAVNLYYEIYQSNPRAFTWHGIKTAALVQRARRDQIELESAPDAAVLATAILSLFEAAELSGEWMTMIAVEAALVLGDHDAALGWLGRFIAAPENDLYQVKSLQQELIDVWQLELSSEPGTSLLPPLRAAILQRGGRLVVENAETPRVLKSSSLERVRQRLEPPDVRQLEWYRVGIARGEAVARIESRSGTPVGTGFLLRGAELHESLGDEPVLITCPDLVSDDPASRNALRPYEAVAVFETRSQTVPLKEILFSSTPLSTAIVRLARYVSDIPPCPVRPLRPSGEVQQLFIIGHPAARRLAISSGTLRDADDQLIHYRVPTEPGSAGSPIYDDEWRLVGIHRGSSPNMRRLHGKPGTYAASEGVRIDAVIRLLGAVFVPPRPKVNGGKPPARSKPAKRPSSKSRGR